MSLEQKINYQLNKVPGIKKYIKRGYQLACYAASKKIKVEGDVKGYRLMITLSISLGITTNLHGTLRGDICFV